MLKSQVYQGMNTQQMHISVDPKAFQDTEHYSGRFPHVPPPPTPAYPFLHQNCFDSFCLRLVLLVLELNINKSHSIHSFGSNFFLSVFRFIKFMNILLCFSFSC